MRPASWFSCLYGYSLSPHEAVTARHGFTAFFFVLASYFILLPLREDVALTLGPSVLPSLFTASLVVTAVAAPLVTSYVVNPTTGSRATGFGRLCNVMCGCLLALWLLLLATSPDPWAPARLLRLLRPGLPAAPPGGQAPPLTYSGYGTAVRVCFYVYLSLQSLLSTSTLWAVCADTFSPATSTRVYGFLGAGATLGQLVASASALAFGAACKRTGAAGASTWLLLPAAWLLLMAARACRAMSGRAEKAGGVTVAAAGAWGTGTAAAAQPPTYVVASASGNGLHDLDRPTLGGASRPIPSPSAPPFLTPPPPPAPPPAAPAAPAAPAPPHLLEGFRLIAASPYLLSACAFLALNYATSATLYFLRAAIVSRAAWLAGSDSRIAFFAALNTASAGVIFAAQMLLTGRVLTRLGVAATLLVGPAVSLVGMAAIGLAPSAAAIAGVEVVRKVVAYALSRPCREVLFTVVSRREKYTAKVVLDTVVQRLGDTAAAALFEVVGECARA
ncbi:hypothetical protein CHLRE_08g361000v5 [Chlamydomonas reinhardtii]|uniref:ADP,ATP carrier protein n=1 Tax=Chlamydomonas reinhardtii TaxID=3055 RepID=A0A2K3DGJ4_CHLRE|nr:uncharacterized protein CHLRE_08g361000v5 [Chlamydomonas reinhardtii]PNW79636.1 hypothetical protein CHLRE_08g361000v5 [Chlamydomonas reinhardtii]